MLIFKSLWYSTSEYVFQSFILFGIKTKLKFSCLKDKNNKLIFKKYVRYHP